MPHQLNLTYYHLIRASPGTFDGSLAYFMHCNAAQQGGMCLAKKNNIELSVIKQFNCY